jgi:hypothetical protein
MDKNKMKKIHISYGTDDYKKSLDLLEQTTLEIGKVNKFIRYTREWLVDQEFYRKNKYILDQPRGGGYWAYKAPCILHTFNELEDGDIVLYSDAGIRVTDCLDPLFSLASQLPNNGKVIFKVPGVHKGKMWIKRDCFVLMNCDEPKYWNADMTNGAVSLWVKNEENINFLKEWLRYCKDPRIISDDPCMMGKPNFLEFRAHRHDQAILMVLSVKYGFEIFRDPTQWGNEEIDKFSNSPYPMLMWHHRNFRH